MTAAAEFEVPRSIPMTFAIVFALLDFVYYKFLFFAK